MRKPNMVLRVEMNTDRLVAIHSDVKVFSLLEILGVPIEDWDQYCFVAQKDDASYAIWNPMEASVGLFTDYQKIAVLIDP